MRLLVVSWGPHREGPGPQDAGLAAALAATGTDVHVLAPGDGGATRTVVRDGMPVTLVGEAPPVIPDDADHEVERVLAFGARAYAAALRVVADRPVDAVLAVGWRTAYVASNLRTSHGVPVVAVARPPASARTAHVTEPELAAEIGRQLAHDARRTVATSAHARRAMARAWRLPARRIAVIPPGVDLPPTATAHAPEASPARVAVVAPPDGAVGAAGRSLVRALRARDVPVVAGTDVDRADVVVVTDPGATHRAVTAMAAGRALVVPESGPLRELVHARRSGLRIEPLDVSGAAATVAALTRDTRRLARLARGGATRARERHGWDRVATHHLAVVRAAVEEETALRDATARPGAGDAVVSMVGRGHGREDTRG